MKKIYFFLIGIFLISCVYAQTTDEYKQIDYGRYKVLSQDNVEQAYEISFSEPDINGTIYNSTNPSPDTDTNLTEDNVEAYIFDNDNTANLNLTGYNVTTNYLKLNNIGGICDLSVNGTICSNATGTYIVG